VRARVREKPLAGSVARIGRSERRRHGSETWQSPWPRAEPRCSECACVTRLPCHAAVHRQVAAFRGAALWRKGGDCGAAANVRARQTQFANSFDFSRSDPYRAARNRLRAVAGARCKFERIKDSLQEPSWRADSRPRSKTGCPKSAGCRPGARIHSGRELATRSRAPRPELEK